MVKHPQGGYDNKGEGSGHESSVEKAIEYNSLIESSKALFSTRPDYDK